MNQGKVELDNVENEFKYTQEHMGLIKTVVTRFPELKKQTGGEC